jgi:hypothetical protein
MDILLAHLTGLTTPLLAFFDDANGAFYVGCALFLAGPIFFGITYARYRNRGERHYHERETPVRVDNLRVYDNYLMQLTGQRSRTIAGANSKRVGGTLVQGDDLLETMTGSLGSLLPGDLGDRLKKFK